MIYIYQTSLFQKAGESDQPIIDRPKGQPWLIAR